MSKRFKKPKPSRRVIPLTPELHEEFEKQFAAFREKFGRDPGPNDPVFFDPDADEPRPYPLEKLNQDVVEAMVQADIDPAKIYAYTKTGVMPTTENQDKMLPEDIEAWNAAIDEYERLTKQEH